MTNLLVETLGVLDQHGKSAADVLFVMASSRLDEDEFVSGSWEDFSKTADKEYNEGYGTEEVNKSLKVVGDGWWLERGRYDGSEWWEFETLPAKPPEGSVSVWSKECIVWEWEMR